MDIYNILIYKQIYYTMEAIKMLDVTAKQNYVLAKFTDLKTFEGKGAISVESAQNLVFEFVETKQFAKPAIVQKFGQVLHIGKTEDGFYVAIPEKFFWVSFVEKREIKVVGRIDLSKFEKKRTSIKKPEAPQKPEVHKREKIDSEKLLELRFFQDSENKIITRMPDGKIGIIDKDYRGQYVLAGEDWLCFIKQDLDNKTIIVPYKIVRTNNENVLEGMKKLLEQGIKTRHSGRDELKAGLNIISKGTYQPKPQQTKPQSFEKKKPQNQK